MRKQNLKDIEKEIEKKFEKKAKRKTKKMKISGAGVKQLQKILRNKRKS